GSGKSNFLDALRFVSEGLTVGLEHAIRNRGNAQRILAAARHASETSFSIEIYFRSASGESGSYGFEIESTSDGGFRVLRERLLLDDFEEPLGPELFSIEEDDGSTHIWASGGVERAPTRDRLFLVSYSITILARPVYDLLKSMVFYDPQP